MKSFILLSISLCISAVLFSQDSINKVLQEKIIIVDNLINDLETIKKSNIKYSEKLDSTIKNFTNELNLLIVNANSLTKENEKYNELFVRAKNNYKNSIGFYTAILAVLMTFFFFIIGYVIPNKQRKKLKKATKKIQFIEKSLSHIEKEMKQKIESLDYKTELIDHKNQFISNTQSINFARIEIDDPTSSIEDKMKGFLYSLELVIININIIQNRKKKFGKEDWFFTIESQVTMFNKIFNEFLHLEKFTQEKYFFKNSYLIQQLEKLEQMKIKGIDISVEVIKALKDKYFTNK